MRGIANYKIEDENRETNKSLVRCVLIAQDSQTINQNRYSPPSLWKHYKMLMGMELKEGGWVGRGVIINEHAV